MSAFDVTTLGLAVDHHSVRQARDELGRFVAAGDKAAQSGSAMEASWSRVKGVLAGIALGATVVELVKQADALTLMDARLKLVVGSATDFAQAQGLIYRIAQQSNVGLAETASLFTKLHDPVRRLGGDVTTTGKIVEAFAASLRVGGASTQEAASATLQFAQAMGSGKLQGDEFRAIAEASPRFMKAMAEGMGVPIEQLKKMGSEGKLTADVVGNALLKSLGSLRTEMAQIPDTVGGAMTRLANDFKVALNDINKASGTTLGLAATIDEARKLIPSLKAEMLDAVQSVDEWLARNREGIVAIWDTTKLLVGDLWEAVRALGAMVGFVTEAGVQTNLFKATLDGVRVVVAGVKDGVELIGAAFAWVGSQVLQFLVAPLLKGGEAAATVVGVFDEKMAAQIRASLAPVAEFAKAGEQYADDVVTKFSDGKSAVGELSASMQKSVKDATQLKEALSIGAVSAADSARELRNMARAADEAAGKTATLKNKHAELTDEEKRRLETWNKLKADLSTRLEQLQAEINGGQKLSETEKLRISLYEKVDAGILKLTMSEKLELDARLQRIIETEKERTEHDLLNEALMAQARHIQDLRNKENEGIDAYLEQLADKRRAEEDAARAAVKSAEDEFRFHGLLKSQVAEIILLRLQEAQANTTVGSAAYNSLQIQIEQQGKLIGLLTAGELRDANEKAAKDATLAWKSFTDGLIDAMMGGVDSFKSYLVRSLKNLVIKIPLQAVMGGVGGSLGIGQGGGTLSDLSSMLSVGNAFSNGGALAGAGSLLFGNSAAYGAALGTTSVGAGSQAAMLAAQTGEFGAAGLAATAEAAGSSLMASLSAAAPYVAAVIALATLLDKKATPHVGGYSLADPTGGVADITAQQGGIQNPLVQKATDTLSTTLAGVLNTVSKTFGKDGGFSVRSVFESDNNDPSWGLFHLLRDGKQQAGSFDALGTLDKDSTKGFEQFATMAAQGTLAALDAMDLPKWASDILAQLGDSPGVEDLAKAVTIIQSTKTDLEDLRASLRAVGVSFAELTGLSDDALLGLANASGGVQAFKSGLSDFVTNFYSESEQAAMRANALSTELKAVGVNIDPTVEGMQKLGREGFRALVQAAIDDGDSSALAALLRVSGAFAALVPVADEVSVKMEDLEGDLASFRRTFATSSQRMAMDVTSITTALKSVGMTVDPTIDALKALGRDGFSAIVESAVSSGDASAVSALLKVADTFDSLVPAAATAGDAVASLAGRMVNMGNGRTYDFDAFQGVLESITPDQMEKATLDYLGNKFPDDQILEQFWVDWAHNPVTQGALANELAASILDEKKRAEREAMSFPQQYGSTYSSGEPNDARQIADDQLNATNDLVASLDALEEKLGDYLDSLMLGDLSVLNPTEQYAQSKSMFRSAAAQASVDDQATVEKLQQAATTFLQQSQKQNASGQLYVNDFNEVVAVLKAVHDQLEEVKQATQTGTAVQASGLSALVQGMASNNDIQSQAARSAELTRQAQNA